MTSLHPAAAGLDYFAEIALHSAGLAAAAEGNLDAAVEHCPGWTVADLVMHTWEVHWFWGTIAERQLAAPPQDEPERPAPDVLVEEFRAGALRMCQILRNADQSTPVWTWAPTDQHIGFISRHQVQEAAVHRWDAEHAAGNSFSFEAPVAIDSIEEFLTYSVLTSDDEPPAEPKPALAGRFVLACTDADASWLISDGAQQGAIAFERAESPDRALPTIHASASDLLLWLYDRVALDVTTADSAEATALLERFRALSFTD